MIQAVAGVFGFLLLLALIAVGLVGCPQYNVYSSRMQGVADMEQAQGSRQALVAQASAEADAAVLRAKAASERVAGWVSAAKDGCASIGLAGDKGCLTQLIQDNVTFSMVHEGNSGVTLIFGGNGQVAVPTVK